MMQRKRLSTMVQLMLCVTIAPVSHVVFAEDNVQVLPTLEVKAWEGDQTVYANGTRARSSNLPVLGNKDVVNTPFTVTTYTSKAIQNAQARNIADVITTDPAIRMQTSGGHSIENFVIRGFELNASDISLNGTYGMAPLGHVPTEILDSVTVVKGPNALLGGFSPGTGSVGGIVMANTKRANTNLTRVFASLENGGYYKSGADFSRRFGANQEFGARVSGVYGTGKHLVKGLEDTLAAGTLALDYTTDKAKVNLDAYSVKADRDGGTPAIIGLTGKVNRRGAAPVQSVNTILKAPKGDMNYFANIYNQQRSNYIGLSGAYKFTPNIDVFAGVGYARKEQEGFLFGTRFVVLDAAGKMEGNYYNQPWKYREFAANVGANFKFLTGPVSHQIGVRADYLSDKQSSYLRPGSTDVTANFYTGSSATAVMPAKPSIYPKIDNKYMSYTLTDQLSMFDDRLQFILGGRYQQIETGTPTKVEYKKSKFSPSVAVVVKPIKDDHQDLSVYASYVEGLSKGDTVTDVNDVNYGKVFAPYQTKQFEVGTKYQVGSWLFTWAFYQIDKPTTIKLPTTVAGKTSETTDDGKVRSHGIEWSFAGNVTKDLSILGNVAYIKTKFVKATTYQGHENYGVPKFTAGLGLDYAIPVVEGLHLNTDVKYIGTQYIDSANTFKLPSYTLVNLGARYNTTIGGVKTTFNANIDNVANKRYWAGAFHDGYALQGAARLYKLGVTFDF